MKLSSDPGSKSNLTFPLRAFASRRVALPPPHLLSVDRVGPALRKAKGTIFVEPEVKLEFGLEGKETGGKECLSGRRFESRGVADAEPTCANYNIRAFLLKASRSTHKAGSKVVEEAGLWC